MQKRKNFRKFSGEAILCQAIRKKEAKCKEKKKAKAKGVILYDYKGFEKE